MGGVSPRCSTCGHSVFHLWAHPVPPVGTKCSTCGHINHGFHGLTMESMERTSTSPLWGLVAAAQAGGGRWGSHEFEERHGRRVPPWSTRSSAGGCWPWRESRSRTVAGSTSRCGLALNRPAGSRILNRHPTWRRTPLWQA